MMSPQSFYQNNIRHHSNLLRSVKKQIYITGSIRLIIVLSGIFFTWLCWSLKLEYLLAIIIFHGILFLIFLKKSRKLSDKKEYTENNIQINKEELKALDHDFSSFDGYPERMNSKHDFSYDLDIFGSHSLFQSINRTKTAFGKNKLADWMENPLTEKQKILERRYSIQELATVPELYLHFRATAMTIKENKKEIEQVLHFISLPPVLKPNRFWKISIFLLPVVWIIIFALLGTGIVGFPLFTVFFFASLVFSYSQTKKINLLNKSIGKKGSLLSTYSALFSIIEKATFSSAFLEEQQAKLIKDKQKTSVAIYKLYSYINSFELGKTFPVGVLFNVLFLWEINYALKIEAWKSHYKAEVKEWFDVIATFDATGSLSVFAFNQPDYMYPEIKETYFRLEGKNLGHPLLKNEQCVRNDICIPHAPYFIIVTGANMAGKSTYLRTIGINMLLGMLGAPACAEEMAFYPARLMTSLRTSDSLNENESYFFAEVKRLSHIIKNLQAGEKVFVILDEILRGTNSIDKHKGSCSLIEQLLSLQTCGIIATHDVSLGELITKYPEDIRNICFEAEVKENELFFSYLQKEGVARNMNACFLMKKMGIDIRDEE